VFFVLQDYLSSVTVHWILSSACCSNTGRAVLPRGRLGFVGSKLRHESAKREAPSMSVLEVNTSAHASHSGRRAVRSLTVAKGELRRYHWADGAARPLSQSHAAAVFPATTERPVSTGRDVTAVPAHRRSRSAGAHVSISPRSFRAGRYSRTSATAPRPRAGLGCGWVSRTKNPGPCARRRPLKLAGLEARPVRLVWSFAPGDLALRRDRHGPGRYGLTSCCSTEP